MAKPTKLKKLIGTFREDRDGAKMDVIPLPASQISKLKPPANFNAEQKQLWTEIIQTLGHVGLLQNIGIHQVTEYCIHFKLYHRALIDIDKKGHNITYDTKHGEITKKNPSYEGAMNSKSIMQGIADRFGFSPLSQSKIKNIGLSPEDEGEERF